VRQRSFRTERSDLLPPLGGAHETAKGIFDCDDLESPPPARKRPELAAQLEDARWLSGSLPVRQISPAPVQQRRAICAPSLVLFRIDTALGLG
jgi:hypothetical protein